MVRCGICIDRQLSQWNSQVIETFVTVLLSFVSALKGPAAAAVVGLEPLLSQDGTAKCATCHVPPLFTEPGNMRTRRSEPTPSRPIARRPTCTGTRRARRQR